MRALAILLTLVTWLFISCKGVLRLSSSCKKCTESPCIVNVGLLANFTESDEIAIGKVVSAINTDVAFQRNWRLQITPLDGSNRPSVTNLTSNQELNRLAEMVDHVRLHDLSFVIGPVSSLEVEWIHPLMVVHNISHIAPMASNPSFLDTGKFPNLIRLGPDSNFQLQAVISLLKFFRYSEMSIVSSHDEYGLSVIEIFRRDSHSTNLYELREATMLQNPINGVEIQKTFQQLKNSKPHMIVLALNKAQGKEVLREASKANLTTQHNWMWIIMDVMTTWLYGDSVSSKSHLFKELLGLRPRHNTNQLHAALEGSSSEISFTALRYIDGLDLVTDRLQSSCQMSKKYGIRGFHEARNGNFFPGSYLVQNHSNLPVFYDVLLSSESGWSVIGNWTSNSTDPDKHLFMAKGTKSIRPENRLRVTTIIQDSFSYFENSNETDLSKLQGYAIDLLKELSRLEGFEYDLQLVKDGQYGIFDETSGQWTGMIGEVSRGEADIAVGPITVTAERAQTVDFLPYYLRLHLDFIIKTAFENNHKYNPYAFLNPFDVSFYGALLVSISVLSIILPGLSTLSPYGIRGSFFQSSKYDECKEADKAIAKAKNYFELSKHHRKIIKERHEAQWNMGINNALFLLWSALFCQSPEKVPQSVSGKIVTIAWYFASTVFVASYTANVVTSVSLYNHDHDNIDSVADLLLLPDVGYGTEKDSIIEAQLRDAQTSTARQIHRNLISGESHLHYFVANESAGIEAVKQGRYAFIYDSIILDLYAVESGCKLKTVPLGFGFIDYAVVVRKVFPMYEALTNDIRKLKQNGFLEALWFKYFTKLGDCDNVHNDMFRGQARSLTYIDLAGVFHLVAAGIFTGCTVLGIEWIVAAFHDVNSSYPIKPATMREALKIRRSRLYSYIHLNWLPVDWTLQKWKKSLPSSETSVDTLEGCVSCSESAEKLAIEGILNTEPSASKILPSETAPNSYLFDKLKEQSSITKHVHF